MTIPAVRTQQPLPALSKLTLVALLINTLVYGIDMLMIGQFDLEIGIVAICLLVVGALVATGWRWAPALAALMVGASFVGGLPFRLHHLSHPGTSDFFATAVVNLACDLAIVIGGIGATIQNYRDDRRTPRWLGGLVTGLAGMISGALLIGGLVSAEATANPMTTSVDGQVTIRLAPGSFEPSSITVSQGEMLALLNDAAIPHVVANGAWEDNAPKPKREPGAPVVNNTQVNDKGEILRIGPFSDLGTYRFYCPLHPGMNLTVVVEQ